MESRHQNIEPSSSRSPRHKPWPIIRLPCCISVAVCEEPPETEPPTIRSPPPCIRTRFTESPEIKDCCQMLIGKSPRRHCGEFRYDPVSYALNFDNGGDGLNAEESRLQNNS
ncbi:uncharacterized protein LOC110024017 [Phalaenopsis equestris]|uniref:uncharacterized protein LOC110024017 n=1 Tax=Phalaenopsis equestris TaxID=78828 RepID=UPI0009E41FDC|nr:uncharacterized protein LOC110024017 [Phalaenopsis equestris]